MIYFIFLQKFICEGFWGLGAEEEKDQVMSSEALGAEKRQKAADGKGVPASKRLGGAGMMSQGKT